MNALEGRVEGQLNAMETTMEEFKVELRGVHQELQELSRVLGRRARNQEKSLEGNWDLVNEGRERKESSEDEMEDDRGEVKWSWMKCVELPTFEGTDMMGWISKTEKFFDLQNIPEREKMKLAYICKEGGQPIGFGFGERRPRTHLGGH